MNDTFNIISIPVDKDIIITVLNYELSIILGVLGIATTIFTVIYSFVETKTQQRKTTERDLITSKVDNPYLNAEIKFSSEYINRNVKLNARVIKIIYASIIMSILVVLNLLFVNVYLFMITQVCAFIYILLFVILILQYILTYKNASNINDRQPK